MICPDCGNASRQRPISTSVSGSPAKKIRRSEPSVTSSPLRSSPVSATAGSGELDDLADGDQESCPCFIEHDLPALLGEIGAQRQQYTARGKDTGHRSDERRRARSEYGDDVASLQAERTQRIGDGAHRRAE